ncbi:MAG: hypothetical protein MUE60_01105 [Candidatus Eisenbacteria bacterium]|jgi:hypothetical protein|nr:hypothetical protein [Candidatus Eisenbacteria bacterium]
MSFWEEVKKGLEEGAQALKKGAEVVAEKTEEAARVARLRYSIYTVRQSIRKAFTELGAHVFELAEHGKPSVWDDGAVLSYLQDVRDGRDRIAELEDEIRVISEKSDRKVTPKEPADADVPTPQGAAGEAPAEIEDTDEEVL